MERLRQLHLFWPSFGLTLLAGTLAAGASPAALFNVPTTFEGRTGCGTLHYAARVTLTLRANATYVIRIVLQGREQSEGIGTWKVDSPDRQLVLDPQSARPSRYQLVDAASLERVHDPNDAPSPTCFEKLRRSPRIVEFSGEMRNVTLSSDVWTLESLDGKRLPFAVAAKPPTIAFGPASTRLVGTTGCGGFTGTFSEKSEKFVPTGTTSKLTIFPHTSTLRVCGSALRDVATRLRKALERTATTHICCSTLELFDKRGMELASFRTTR